MISKVIDTIAANPPPAVTALITLMGTVLQDDKYRQLVNSELKSLPHFEQRRRLLENGYFSGQDLLQLLIACGSKNGSNVTVANSLISQLIDWALVSDQAIVLSNGSIRFLWNKQRIAQFVTLGILDNVLLGPAYIAQKYRQSVPAIFVNKAGDEFTGTGFLATNQPNAGKHVLVTARHNVDPAEGVTSWQLGSPEGVSYRALASQWILPRPLIWRLYPSNVATRQPQYFRLECRVCFLALSLLDIRGSRELSTHICWHTAANLMQ